MRKKDLKGNIETYYSQKAKQLISDGISDHYGISRTEEKWQMIEEKFAGFIAEESLNREEINRLRNISSIYDCLLLFAYYDVCSEAVNRHEIQNIRFELSKERYEFLKSKINFNSHIAKSFTWLYLKRISRLDRKGRAAGVKTFEMEVRKYSLKDVGFEVRTCPIFQFAKEHGYEKIMPAFCNADFYAARMMNSRLIKNQSLTDDQKCDFLLIGDKDICSEQHKDIFDDNGYIKTVENR